MLKQLFGCAVLVVMIGLSACGDGVVVAGPQIESFAANPMAIEPGENSLLSWSVAGRGETTLTLDQGIGDVSGDTRFPVSPLQTTTYTLTATSEFGSDRASVTVFVGEVPVEPNISSLTATSSSIGLGESSTLAWDVSGDATLTLDPGDVDVTGQSSVSVSPDETTMYTLTATNDFGSDRASVTVNVSAGNAPTISSFSATPSSIGSGESSTLTWEVSGDGTVTLTIDQGVGDVTGMSNVSVSPSETTMYTLTAMNEFGSDTALVTVEVDNQPAPIALRPTSSNCDGVQVGSTCEVRISLLNAPESYEGLEFAFESGSFSLVGADTTSLTDGCLVGAGTRKVILACSSAFVGSGEVAVLTVERTSSDASSFVVEEAFVAPDSSGKLAVEGGTLAVSGS